MAERAPWRESVYRIIFGHETAAGRAFDVALIVAILVSVLVVVVESVPSIRATHGPLLLAVEWVFTLVFTIEYGFRLAVVRRPSRYATSFFGLIDLASILPTYLGLVFPATHYLLVIRILRVLRVFRILKLMEYVGEADVLLVALRESRRKVAVFIATVVATTVILGAFMYLIEGGTPGFTSIPTSIYWTIVTITTVGYGDIAPRTPLGQALASVVMLLGYALVAVPTGIVTMELSRARQPAREVSRCPACGSADHDPDARFCKRCGERMTREPRGPPPAAVGEGG